MVKDGLPKSFADKAISMIKVILFMIHLMLENFYKWFIILSRTTAKIIPKWEEGGRNKK